nr:ethanolamine ammonia-lyase subunit EutB [Phycisphaerales bacterium]
MAGYAYAVGTDRYVFEDLKDLMAKATPLRSGDQLAGVAAADDAERAAA